MNKNKLSKVLVYLALFIIVVTVSYILGNRAGFENGKVYVLNNQVIYDDSEKVGYYYSMLDNEVYGYWYE